MPSGGNVTNNRCVAKKVTGGLYKNNIFAVWCLLQMDVTLATAVWLVTVFGTPFVTSSSIALGLLPRCMECRRGLTMRFLSVCLSVKRVHCDKTKERYV